MYTFAGSIHSQSMLEITLAPFAYKDVLARIPVMRFASQSPGYWLLLPVFEAIEAETDVFIDLGGDAILEPALSAKALKPVQKAIDEAKKEINPDALLQRDNEIQADLLEKLHNMLELSVKHKVPLIAKTTDT